MRKIAVGRVDHAVHADDAMVAAFWSGGGRTLSVGGEHRNVRAPIRIEARQQPAGPRKHWLPVPDGSINAEQFNVASPDPAIGHLVKAMEERRHLRPGPRAQRESEEDPQDALQRLIVGVVDAALSHYRNGTIVRRLLSKHAF